MMEKILENLSSKKWKSTNQILNEINNPSLTWYGLQNILNELLMLGKVERIKTNKEILWRKKNEKNNSS